MDKKDNPYAPDFKIQSYLNKCGISKDSRDNKLSNSRIRQITYTLYIFNEIVTSEGVKDNVIDELNDLFFKRIVVNKDYYKNNELLKSIYNYFEKIIRNNYVKNID